MEKIPKQEISKENFNGALDIVLVIDTINELIDLVNNNNKSNSAAQLAVNETIKGLQTKISELETKINKPK